MPVNSRASVSIRVMDDADAMRHHGCMLRGAFVHAVVVFVALSVASQCVSEESGASISDFARAPAFALPTLSPNGKHVSYVDQRAGRQIVFVRALDRDDPKATLSVDPPNEIVRWCEWADIQHVLCGTLVTARKQHAIVESTRLYAIDVLTREVRELNAREELGSRDQVIDFMPGRAEMVLLQRDRDGRGFPEVVELNIVTGKLRTVVRSRPPVRSWMSDGRGAVRLGVGYDNAKASLFVRDSGTDDWRAFVQQSLFDPDAIGPLAFGRDEHELFVLKHHRGRAALFRLDPSEPSEMTLLKSDPLYDVGGPVTLDPATRELLAVQYLGESPTLHVFAEREKELQAWFDGQLPATVNSVVQRSLDGSSLLISSGSDTNPPSLYLANTKTRRLELLGHQYPELESRRLSPMRSLMYAARDGQRIPAYLTAPIAAAKPGPAIVLPHGGPETRDVRKFDPLVQFLAAKGYVVLQMNFRGSLGYGAGFAAAGARQWGGVIHNDITDGARWLVERQIADPQRICVMGLSFGGYAALLGAAKESQWYACAVSYAGASDLMAFAQFTQRLPDAPLWRERLGDEPRALWQMSPLAMVWRIETPIMLIHGRRDAVVPISQSRRMARALQEADKDHELIEQGECDHAMTAESCRMAVFNAINRFLDRTVGSAHEAVTKLQ